MSIFLRLQFYILRSNILENVSDGSMVFNPQYFISQSANKAFVASLSIRKLEFMSPQIILLNTQNRLSNLRTEESVNFQF